MEICTSNKTVILSGVPHIVGACRNTLARSRGCPSYAYLPMPFKSFERRPRTEGLLQHGPMVTGITFRPSPNKFVISTGAYPDSCLAAVTTSRDAALRRERRTNFITATGLNRKSGVPQWRDLPFLFLVF
jgi:hypothetical protein